MIGMSLADLQADGQNLALSGGRTYFGDSSDALSMVSSKAGKFKAVGIEVESFRKNTSESEIIIIIDKKVSSIHT